MSSACGSTLITLFSTISSKVMVMLLFLISFDAICTSMPDMGRVVAVGNDEMHNIRFSACVHVCVYVCGGGHVEVLDGYTHSSLVVNYAYG